MRVQQTNNSLLADLQADLSACRRCVEAGYPIESPPVFSSPPGARIMLIGQAPGMADAGRNQPFSGEAGRRLFRWLARAGWEERVFRSICHMTAVTKCFPGRQPSGGGDRVPSAVEQKLCRPWLDAELALVQPILMIPVGMLAIRLFFEPGLKLEQIIGTARVDDQGRQIVPLPHPSGASRWHREPGNLGRIEMALHRLRLARADLGL